MGRLEQLGGLPGRGELGLGFEADGLEKLRVKERHSRLGHSTNKGLGMDSVGKLGAVRFPNGPRSGGEKRRTGQLELAKALEGGMRLK